MVVKTENQFAFEGEAREHKNGGFYTAEYRGFVRPLDATPKADDSGNTELRVWMESSKATSMLNISTDANPDNAVSWKQLEALLRFM